MVRVSFVLLRVVAEGPIRVVKIQDKVCGCQY